MPPQYHSNICLPLFLGDLPESGKIIDDDVEMPGSRLKIGFHGDRGVSEQIFIIPFRERGRLVCRVEPGYAIIVNDAR